jgi:hypothetical protein
VFPSLGNSVLVSSHAEFVLVFANVKMAKVIQPSKNLIF